MEQLAGREGWSCLGRRQQGREGAKIALPRALPTSRCLTLVPLPTTPPHWSRRSPAFPPRWLDWFLIESLPQLPRFQPRELANTLWALARLGHAPAEPWMAALLASTAARLCAFRPAELTALAWALAALRYHPGDDWLRSFQAAAAAQMEAFEAPELAAVARALAKLRAVPGPAFLSALGAAIEARFAAFDAAGAAAALTALNALDGAAAAPGGEWEPEAAADVDAQALPPVVVVPAVAALPEPRVVVLGSGWARPLMESGGGGGGGGGGSVPQLRSAAPPASLLRRLQQLELRREYVKQQQLGVVASPQWLESFLTEAHGMAALMSLMPEWLLDRLRLWPRAWVAQRIALGGGNDAHAGGSARDRSTGKVELRGR
jgi:hypothetical protein